MHGNGKHTANYLCAISQKGEQFTAEGVGCVDQINRHFRRPKLVRFYIYSAQCFRFRFLYIARVFHKSGIGTKFILQGCTLIYTVLSVNEYTPFEK